MGALQIATEGVARLIWPFASSQSHGEDGGTLRGAPSGWPEHMAGQSGQPVRVLLIDDDEHIRRVIAQELMGDPRTLVVAQGSNLREGRRMMKLHDFDVMLVDLYLGDGEGFELIETMKQLHPAAEAIVISLMDEDEQVVRAFEMGATGYLVKNSVFGSYAQAVLQVVNGGASITPHLARRMLQRFAASAPEVGGKRRGAQENEPLSSREKEVLGMVAAGYTSAEIAEQMRITAATVETHIRNIYRKLQVRSRAQAVRFASLRGLF
jgi:DNA-binding NarL/FixJ family response regulator